ncbi:hypothetical protein VTK56DRAFT_2522 [Thermocarpiscus australiensis]
MLHALLRLPHHPLPNRLRLLRRRQPRLSLHRSALFPVPPDKEIQLRTVIVAAVRRGGGRPFGRRRLRPPRPAAPARRRAPSPSAQRRACRPGSCSSGRRPAVPQHAPDARQRPPASPLALYRIGSTPTTASGTPMCVMTSVAVCPESDMACGGWACYVRRDGELER